MADIPFQPGIVNAPPAAAAVPVATPAAAPVVPAPAAAPVVPPEAAKLSFPVSEPGTVPTPPPSNEFFPTPAELAAATPAPAATGEFFPTPEELKAAQPAEFFPLREMSVDELAKMSKADPTFNPLDEYRKSGGTDNSKLDPELWDKARDTYNKLKQDQSWRDLHPVDMAVNLVKTVPEMGKWIWSLDKSLAYAVNHPEVAAGIAEHVQAQIKDSAVAKLPAVAAIQDKLNALKTKEAPKPFSPEVEAGYLDLMQERAEAFAGLKSKAVGLGQMVQNAPGILGRKLGILKQAKDYTPAEKDADFRTALSQRKAVETAATSYPTERVQNILQETGRPLRPEEVSAQAAGEPFSWGAMGAGFGAIGKGLNVAAAPLRAGAAAIKDATSLARGITDVGQAAEVTAKVTAEAAAKRAAVQEAENIAADAAANPSAPGFLARNFPKVTKGALAVKGGFLGAPSLFGIISGAKEGARLGEKLGEGIVSGVQKAGGVASALKDFGNQVATGEGISSRTAQLLRSGVESVPGVAKQAAAGAAFDAALYGGTVETPEQARGFVPFGTVFGAAGGAKEVGARVLTGQTIGARKIGDIPTVSSSGLHPELDALHNSAMGEGIADDRNFINGSRALSQGAGAKNDIYFSPPPATGEADPLVTALTNLKKPDGTPAFTPERAQQIAAQNGAHLTDPLGDGRDITVVRNPPSAPHEAAHALEKVLGEQVMKGLRDSIQQKQTDAGNWDAMGRHYTRLVTGADPGANWRESLLQNNVAIPRQGETPTQAADRYIASENFAEHVDAMFKHGGGVLNPHQGIADHIWNTIAGTVRKMGGNPIAGAASDVLHFPLDYDYINAIKSEAGKVLPQVAAPLKPGKQPLILPRGAVPTNAVQKQEAAKEAQAAVVKATGTPQQPQVTNISDAIRTGGGVKLDTKTETGKDFLPVRMDRGLLLGFDPNIFNQNAHALARHIADLPAGHPLRTMFETDPELSQFGVNAGDRSFSQAGWDLFNKYADAYAKNQQQGFTGAGKPLVVPENIIAAGQAFKPEQTGTPQPIPQKVADLMNHLYSEEGGLGVQKSNIARGKLPGNIRDVAIAEATGGAARVSPLPGREFAGKQAKKLGIEGRPILEVNPLRAAMKKADPNLPPIKGVLQHLNMAEITKVEPATLPNRVVNTLTTHAGFQPMERTPIEIEGPDGKKYRATHDGYQDFSSIGMGIAPQLTAVDDLSHLGGPVAKSTTYGPSLEKKGFKLPELRPPTRAEGGAPTETQFQAKPVTEGRKSKQDYELKTGPGLFSKAWILPDGKPMQLGGQFHHEWINENPDVAKKYGLKATTSGEDNRVEALQKGFARVNYDKNTGTLKVEARQQDWPKLRESVREIARVNMPKLDNMDVHLLDGKAGKIVEQDGVALHTYDPEERMDHLPLISEPTPTTTMSPQASAEVNFQPPAADKIDDLEKVRNASRYQSMWMHPSGDIYNAHDSHLYWAGKNIEGAREHQNGAVEGALGKGYARLANMSGYIAAEHRGLNPKQQGAMEDLAQATGKMITDDKGHTVAEPSMAEAQFQAKRPEPETGKEIEFPYRHNVERAPFMGASYAQDIEPRGEYLNYHPESRYPFPNQEYGTVKFKNPLVLEHKETGHGGWKTDLSKQFGGKTGKRLSDAVIGAGHDGIITRDNNGDIREVVNLAGNKNIEVPAEAAFKDETKLADALKQPGWALFTATQESKGAGTDKVNVEANDQLEKELRDAGFDPIEVKGNYKGVDQGKNFIVPGMTQEQATEWGNKFGQESVLTNKGLIYNDGTLSPVNHDNTVVGKEAKNLDFYSQVPGGPAFSMGIDFHRRIPLKKTALAQQELLGGGTEKVALSSKQVGEMGTKALREYYPEAYVPNQVRNKAGEMTDPLVPSAITEAPLIKGMDRPTAVKTYAAKLVEEAKKWIDHPNFQAGLKWYSEFTPQLKRVYGKHAQMMAELLAATSPNSAPETNFAFANDALQGYKAGRFDKQIKKFEEGAEKVKDGTWEKWLSKADPEGVQSEANFLQKWIEKYDLRPKQSNGKLYGMHSDAVLQVFARQWLEQTQGPKTQNFVQNLLGTGHEATVDVWADRTMRRLGYQDSTPRWRILPKNSTGVSDADFALSQEVFHEAAKQLNITPDALQGGLWFSEKQHWADNAWGRLDLGDYRKEIGKVPMLESGIQQRLAAQKAQAKAKPMEQTGFDLVTPAPRR